MLQNLQHVRIWQKGTLSIYLIVTYNTFNSGVLNTSIVIYQSISKVLWVGRMILTSSALVDGYILSVD